MRMRKINNKRAFTLVEGLVAACLALVMMTVFWAFFRNTTQANARMAEVMKTMDAATLQTRLDEDIRTSIEVIAPAALSSASKLEFYDREYKKITYELRPKGKSFELVRRAEGAKGLKVITKKIKQGLFYRTGPRLVGYLLDFEPLARPGAARDSKPMELSLASKVFLSNGMY